MKPGTHIVKLLFVQFPVAVKVRRVEKFLLRHQFAIP